MENKQILLKNIFWTVLYAIFTLIIVLHHEIWADEAQVWQICRNLNIFELFKHLVNEGHPSFFYLLNMPFAKLLHGPSSILAMQLICWSAMCASVFLLLQFAPFKGFTKFAIITSSGFLYFLPVIARSYSILPLLVFALALLYPKAKEHPYWYSILITICVNTHVLMFGFAFILGVYFAIENRHLIKKKDYISSCVIILGGLLAVILQLCLTMSSNVFIDMKQNSIVMNALDFIIKFFINGINGSYQEILAFLPITVFDLILILISALLYLSLFIFLFKLRKKYFLIALIGIGFQFFTCIKAYSSCVFVTRIFCSHIILLFAFWQILKNNKALKNIQKGINIILSIFFILTFLNGIKFSILDFKYSYSGSKDTAEFIEKNISPENSIIVTDNGPYCISLVFYLYGKQGIYSMIKNDFTHYIYWDETLLKFVSTKNWKIGIDYLKENNELFKNKKVYIVMPYISIIINKIQEIPGFKQIFESKDSILRYEKYRIYEYLE